jgi:hypothetical protein
LNQSAYIVGALLGGFVLFVASRGRLGLYTSVLWGSGPAPAKPAGPAGRGLSGALGGLKGGLSGVIPGLDLVRA